MSACLTHIQALLGICSQSSTGGGVRRQLVRGHRAYADSDPLPGQYNRCYSEAPFDPRCSSSAEQHAVQSLSADNSFAIGTETRPAAPPRSSAQTLSRRDHSPGNAAHHD